MTTKLRKELFWVVLNSASAYSTAMIWLVFAERFFQAGLAKLFGIQTQIYYHRIDMLSDRAAWTRTAVFFTYLSPSVFDLFLALFITYFHFYYRRSPELIRLYLFWGMVAGFNLFLSNFVYSAFVYKGFAVALRWLYMPQTVNVMLGMVGAAMLFFMGFVWVKPLLKMAHSQEIAAHLRPRFFLFWVALLPYLLSSAGFAMLLFTSAETQQITWVHACIGIMILGTLLVATPYERNIMLVKNFAISRFSLSSFLFILISLILFKLSLYRGF